MILIESKDFDRTALLPELHIELTRQCLYRFLWSRLVPEELLQWRIAKEDL